MQWNLFLLVLMGQCDFFICRLYEYHFIDQNKTWKEAQTYCRKYYTDLATVFDMTDMERLGDLVKQREAWIGLYNEPGGQKEWHWSLPGVDYNENESQWRRGDPNDVKGVENCVAINTNHLWIDVPCNRRYYSFCYKESMKSNEKFHLINERMTWPKAQKYCREHHTDLISGYDQLKNLSAEIPQTLWSWIGLFRDTWRWSDGSRSSFRNWENLEASNSGESKKKCAVTMNGSRKFSAQNCGERKPFVCYDDKVILIKQNKTWDEALYYCREHHRDLASITNHHQQRWIQERAKNASTPFVWLGLRYTCTLHLWFWVSDDLVCYDNWAADLETDTCDKSAAMQRGEQHRWVKKADTEVFNFVCALP